MTAWVDASNLHGELPSIRVNLDHWIGRMATLVRKLGPYAAIELLLPGGSLIALLLWLYWRHKKAGRRVGRHAADGVRSPDKNPAIESCG